jgi:hypothetical protein
MTPKQHNDDYPSAEAIQRHDAALRAALSMPSITHAESSRKTKKKTAPQRRLEAI